MRALRHARTAGLNAWEALTSTEDKIRGLEAERDDLISEAEKAEASGDKYGPAYWNRHEAERIQERINEARRPKCAGCGQHIPGANEPKEGL
jgi:hypothetical protein